MCVVVKDAKLLRGFDRKIYGGIAVGDNKITKISEIK